MKKLTKTEGKNILRVIEKNRSKKWISLEFLSSKIGIYPEVLGEMLSDFDPLALLDPSFDVKSIESPLREFLEKAEKKETTRRVVASKKAVGEYQGLNDFIYKKMTGVGGLFDKDVRLSDKDLAILRKLLNEEIKSRKKEKKNGR